MKLENFIERYKYTEDGKYDTWEIPKLIDGKYMDDCDGLALGVLYYVLANESLFKFWYLLIFTKVKLFYVVTSNSVGHMVLRDKAGRYIDTYSKEWVSEETMLSYGHKFSKLKMYYFPQVALKMGITKVLNLFTK